VRDLFEVSRGWTHPHVEIVLNWLGGCGTGGGPRLTPGPPQYFFVLFVRGHMKILGMTFPVAVLVIVGGDSDVARGGAAQRTSTFPPSIAEIVAACDARLEWLRTVAPRRPRFRSS
jgi:hypothetical protein